MAFLDSTGLSHLWNKITAYVDEKVSSSGGTNTGGSSVPSGGSGILRVTLEFDENEGVFTTSSHNAIEIKNAHESGMIIQGVWYRNQPDAHIQQIGELAGTVVLFGMVDAVVFQFKPLDALGFVVQAIISSGINPESGEVFSQYDTEIVDLA